MTTIVAALVALIISIPAFAEEILSFESDPPAMPEEVKANIAELRQYGDRFEKVIAGIEAEWAKPTWVDGVDCPDEAATLQDVGS